MSDQPVNNYANALNGIVKAFEVWKGNNVWGAQAHGAIACTWAVLAAVDELRAIRSVLEDLAGGDQADE